MARRRYPITADFPGAKTPVGSVVRFRGPATGELRGKITGIRIKHADVSGEDGSRWSVPYAAITNVESAPAVECTLVEVEEIAHRLIDEFTGRGALKSGWTFGFDLAPSRAGVCRYNERRIDLSVSYCLAATRAEIEDTVLHEIAHAIVGARHNHDGVWKAKAREIGCVGERCHRVQHSVPKWVGECGCGQQWFRQTLQRRMIGNRICAKCHGSITWRRNTDAPML
ncbi:MAG: hypothetical protein F4X64_09700 [Chloroflexi bacterium]|nr:hypothetical protein [Chloroflexota bacterium]